jgi:(p)ppGpp synthase/HD superfamily hydrolase
MKSERNPELNKAIKIAAEFHVDQYCWNGEPYFAHVMRVMNAVETPRLKVVGVLHDVLEDNTSLLVSDLIAMGIEVESVRLVSVLTRQQHEPYDHYIGRIMSEPVVIPVKIADLEDNMDLTRIPFDILTQSNLDRLSKYHSSWMRLKKRQNALAQQYD